MTTNNNRNYYLSSTVDPKRNINTSKDGTFLFTIKEENVYVFTKI